MQNRCPVISRDLLPTSQQRDKLDALVHRLGNADFGTRNRATTEIIHSPRLIRGFFVVASTSKSPEVRWRARMILDERNAIEELYAVLQVVSHRKPAGVLPSLVAVIPHCVEPHLQLAFRRAIVTCARPDDVGMLREWLHHENANVRIASAFGLAAMIGRAAQTDLNSLLKDADDRVQVAVAGIVADWGDRKSLPALISLLTSEDLNVRVAAASKLRQVSGKHFGFTAYALSESRDAAIERWNTWLQDDGITIELLKTSRGSVTPGRYLGGNTLLAFGNRHNKVVEYDPSGKEVWTYVAQAPRSAEKLPNGNVLIAEFDGHRVIEVDRQGVIIWEYNIQMPLTVQVLANGNILIAQFNESQVVEVNRQGEVVWVCAVPGNCCAADRLDNGNTLIASYGQSVMEVTPHGNVVWEYPTLTSHGCRSLPNGNVLIAMQPNGHVIEVTRENKIVWECRHAGAVDAFRLPNGNTLISGLYQFVEMTHDKQIVWSQDNCEYGTARR